MTTLRVALLLALAATVRLGAQEQGQYRDFQLGASVASVSMLAEARATDVTLVHERPALMQELRWTPSYFGTSGPTRSRGEGLQQIAFSFYEDQLSRMMIDYDRSRTRGMTDHDMVDAISAVYGETSSSTMMPAPADTIGSEAVASRQVARWSRAGYTVTLSRWAYGAAFRLVVESTRLTALARVADARALVLDVQEGPQREAARARQEQQDKHDAEADARTANKAAFHP